MPETMAPTNPEMRMIQSTTVIPTNTLKAVEKASDGAVKYLLTGIPSIIIITIKGYKKAINHVLRSSIFKIKANPKKITKYKIIETICCMRCANFTTSITFYIPGQSTYHIKIKNKQKQD